MLTVKRTLKLQGTPKPAAPVKPVEPESPKVPDLPWLFKPIDRPADADNLSFPKDITKISSGEVGGLLGRYTAMHAYALSEESKYRIAEKRVETELELLKNSSLRDALNRGEKVAASRRSFNSSPKLADLLKALTEATEMRTHIATYAAIFDKYISALSRELSRRGSEAGAFRSGGTR